MLTFTYKRVLLISYTSLAARARARLLTCLLAFVIVALHMGNEYRIRSFVKRQGRITLAQKRAASVLGHSYKAALPAGFFNFEELFGDSRPVVLEIGFGMGDATALIAQANAHIGYLGVEVYDAGVGKLLMRIEELGLRNVRIAHEDAVLVLDKVAMASLAGVHVFFPDPWPKKRHHKRRLMQPDFIKVLALRLQKGGRICFASDWQPYAEAVLGFMEAEPLLKNVYGGFALPQNWRPPTRFQVKGQAAARPICELVFERV